MTTLKKAMTALTGLVAGALVLTACSGAESSASGDPTFAPQAPQVSSVGEIMAAEDFGLLDARNVIEVLEAAEVSDRPAELFASIRPNELVLTDLRTPDAKETVLPLAQDDFYVSFAPYITGTHDCFYHSLTTCLGELGKTTVAVLIVDNATGATIVDRTVTTEDNGFFGLWMAPDLDATITITYGELSVTAPMSTGIDDPTCVTTLQLS